MKTSIYTAIMSLAFASLCCTAPGQVEFRGLGGPGYGKHIVLLAGDEEYRSEEAMPMLARILATQHGFKCTVVLPINPANGTIDPNTQTNLPGIDALDTADVCIMALRFRELPDAQMKHFVEYHQRGKPFIALRTSTHAFQYTRNPQSPYAKYDWRNKEWPGGFGQQVLGETWVSHHGVHGKESTRGIVNRGKMPNLQPYPFVQLPESHQLMSVLSSSPGQALDIWGPSDVYTVSHLPKDAQVLLLGQVLVGMDPRDLPVAGAKNDPMMPLAWTRELKTSNGGIQKIFTTTMGAAVDLKSEDLRRLLVGACYWAADLPIRGPVNAEVVGEYKPTMFGFGKFKPGVKPADVQAQGSQR